MSRPKVAVGLFFLLAVAGPAAGQTRTFFDAQCSYTKPGVEWEWIDPKAVNAGEACTLIVARNPSGLTFTLRYRPEDQRPDANSFGTFEDNLLASGKYKKLGSKRLLFKGAWCYQVDVQSTRDDECSRIRLLFANDKVYLFSVTYTPGPLGPDEEMDFVFKGFEFRPPEDVREDERAQAGSRWSAGDVSAAALVGLLVVLAGIIWKVIRIRAEASRY